MNRKGVSCSAGLDPDSVDPITMNTPICSLPAIDVHAHLGINACGLEMHQRFMSGDATTVMRLALRHNKMLNGWIRGFQGCDILTAHQGRFALLGEISSEMVGRDCLLTIALAKACLAKPSENSLFMRMTQP